MCRWEISKKFMTRCLEGVESDTNYKNAEG